MGTTIQKSGRVKAIDVLRGMTVAGMILVNNPGSWGHMYAPLRHAPWNGLTPTDLIFPFFLFIMGVSMYISMSKQNFEPTPQLYRKIFKRTILLILIGWLVGTFSYFLRMWYVLGEDPSLTFWQRLGQSLWSLPTLRILGVFPRLGLTYCIAALLTLWLTRKDLVKVSMIVLVLYAVLLLIGNGNGYEYGEANILARVDRAILTPAHMYSDKGVDPEGILSTIPASIQVVVGVLVGHVVMNMRGDSRLVRLFVIGVSMALVGYILGWWLPVNKKVWSPTFVFVTCGLGTTLLALLIYTIDHKGHEKWTRFFAPFGVNPLFTYLASTVLALLFLRIRIPTTDGFTTVASWGYQSLFALFEIPKLASFVYSLIFLLINWGLGYILYKKKIYIKL
ncbi:MAG: heparan-alpha-glucosaminide N-acetyltransferase domain-containing protein [Porphyromonas sp.]|nr:heparan-alpha-glucosaminide N-acetyltransferase domain-containing protein [Porphyromonas sp.]